MQPAAIKLDFGTADDYWIEVYACPESDCGRLYNITHGYFNFRDRMIERDTKKLVGCKNDSLPMFIEAVSDGRAQWRCGQDRCNHTISD